MFTYAGAYATHKARCHPELMASAPAACIGDADADADADAAVAEENEDASNAITRDSAELDWAVVIVDVETTGCTGTARITQIAARTANGMSVFNELVKPPPGTFWSAEAKKLNGIDERKVEHARPFKDVIAHFMAWLERLDFDHILFAGHNVLSFDRHRLAYEFSQLPCCWPHRATIKLALG
jgi:DNA polymerase III epsilon subunit-like protein